MTIQAARQSVFISYSHRDRKWLDRLNVHLRPLVRDSALVIWDDTKITPGSLWEKEIESALSTTRVAILLVSADFLASDFIAHNEIPPLLAVARDGGAVILPLIISASRFSQMPALAQFQAVNDPSKPLNRLSRPEQEAILVRLTEVVERAMGSQQSSAFDAKPAEDTNTLPLLKRLRLRECLERLGCSKELIEQEEDFIRRWVQQDLAEPFGRQDGLDVRGYLKKVHEPVEVQEAVDRFVDRLVHCCSPQRGLLNGWYVSTRKVSDTYRILQREIEAARPLGASDAPFEKLITLHEYLLKTDRLTFLPERLLLEEELPSRDDEIFYFAGSFTLDLDQAEMRRVPGVVDVMAEKETRSIYGVVSAVFQNSDPFVYPLLRFTGSLDRFPVAMILSRKYIQFSSGTASSLAEALTGHALALQGIGTLKISNGTHEIHPISCSEND